MNIKKKYMKETLNGQKFQEKKPLNKKLAICENCMKIL